ncbi:MAG TPA: M15 family metallopeptidase [Hymenobacter sp.]|uniref:M15 family metallopeptidase n=1 Tax=Hymenobacter sp. TaxID=1898978 RepID=UPI002D7F1974|nr:M15 family metallopeptidase [Hymenobacter sp.]HET9503309.1 M15 family metallopeptidase [Hymenobacter sp.]
MTDSQRCFAAYGNPSLPAFAAQWLVRHPLPLAVRPFFPAFAGKPITALYLHRLAAPALDKVLLELVATGLARELRTYDGCWAVRCKRGLAEYSIHSWGLALDFNAALNPLGRPKGGPGMWSEAFLNVWRRHGWTCGADWKARPDGMHFQYVPGAI